VRDLEDIMADVRAKRRALDVALARKADCEQAMRDAAEVVVDASDRFAKAKGELYDYAIANGREGA
jgi:hypothetical protein